MLFECIIITGTSFSGKSEVADELCRGSTGTGDCFEQVKIITTNKNCSNSKKYEYISDTDYSDLQKNDALLTDSTCFEKKYGIKYEEYMRVKGKNKIPVLVISPNSASKLLDSKKDQAMCFFLDASDELLLERWNDYLKKEATDKNKIIFIKQCKNDREQQDRAHYIINNSDYSTTSSLITMLWERQNQGGALSQQIITNMIKCGLLLRDADLKMIKGASYDLRLGDEYYYDGLIQKLSDSKPFLTIEPYDYAIVSCLETAWIPRDVIGKFGLSVGLFCQGIILSNGPQIDPGFRGTLFCMLFNTSNRAVHIKRGKHYATIEFNKLLGYSEPYVGKYQGKDKIIEYIPENALHGAINELKREVESLKNESHIMQNIYLGVVALMFAIISMLLVIQ